MSKERRPGDRLAARILWGMTAGLVLGAVARLVMHLQPAAAETLRWTAAEILDPTGQVFLRTLFFIVVPLVFASLALGVAQLGRLDRLGPLAGKTFALFGLNMAIGVLLGLLIMNTVRPGARLAPETRATLLNQYGGAAAAEKARAAEQPQLSLRQMVDMFMPRNLLRAVVDFEVLPLIVFALLLGAAGTMLLPDGRATFQRSLSLLVDLCTHIVHFALWLAPVAVGAMMASVVIKTGLDVLGALLVFVLCVLGGITLHLFGTMSLWVRWLAGRSPTAFFRAIRSVLVTAFSTSSSNATLPTSIAVSREELGVSAGTAGFVLPLGATMNMSGTALYEGCVVLFVAQAFGVPLSLGSQITLVVLTVVSAVAVAGIPAASLPVIVGLLSGFGLPPEGIALVIGVDRLLDMARTVLNVGADLVTACIVDRWSGPSAEAAVPPIPPAGS